MADEKTPSLEEFLALDDENPNDYKRHLEALRSEVRDLKTQLSLTSTRKSSKPQTHLIIGDSHSDPTVPNDRYRWLGALVADLRPDVVVDIGDWADMSSLGRFDVGKRSFEGRRYKRDIEASIEARELFDSQLGPTRPRLISVLGNHEHRIVKATDDDPKLDGLIATSDLRGTDFGWETYDFGVPAIVDGICYKHYFPSGVNGRPVGGMHTASALVRLGLMSCVQGHSHTFDYAERTRADGGRVLGMSVGCYFEHWMAWAGDSNSLYWRGIVVLRDVVDGFGAVEKIPLETIKCEYGP